MDKKDLVNIEHPDQEFEKLRKMGVSLVAKLDTRFESKRKQGHYTVRMQIIHSRKFKMYSLKMQLTMQDYMSIAVGAPRKQDLKDKRKIIYNDLKQAHDAILKMRSFSFAEFEKRFFNRGGDLSRVGDAYLAHIEDLKQRGRIATAETFRLALSSFKAYKLSDITIFNDITPKWLRGYEQYMLSSGKSPSTISIYVRTLRKMFNDAIREGEANRDLYPFGSEDHGLYTPPEASNPKKALKLEEIKKIFEYEPEPRSTEHFMRDMWIFSYLCNGMNMADICYLQYKNLDADSITFLRRKTSSKRRLKPVVVARNEHIDSIIDRWGTPIQPNNYVFNVLSHDLTPERQLKKIKHFTHLCNDYMKDIAKKIGITEKISTYYARHSFATVLKYSGTDVTYISEALGHSNLKTTENYLSSFDNERRQKESAKLTDF